MDTQPQPRTCPVCHEPKIFPFRICTDCYYQESRQRALAELNNSVRPAEPWVANDESRMRVYWDTSTMMDESNAC